MKNLPYILMVLLGGVLYGMMSSFVKLFYTYGYNAAELSFGQALGSAIVLAPTILLVKDKKSSPLDKKGGISLLLTGAAIGMSNFLYYQSVSYIPASLAIVILMQFTWISLLLDWLFYQVQPSKIELLTVLLILIGTLFASGVFEQEIQSFSWVGIAFALATSFTYASYIVANSRIKNETAWQVKSTLIMTGSAICIFMVNAKTIMTSQHFDLNYGYMILFLSILGTTIPTVLFVKSIPKIGAGISSILMTIELPIAVICAHLVLGESLSKIQLLGIVTMLGAIVWMNYVKTKKQST